MASEPESISHGLPVSSSKKRGWGRLLTDFVKKNPVLCIAVLAAAVTACFVPPDGAYGGYFDFRTLSCLFCVLAVVCALREIRFFEKLARAIVDHFTGVRSCFFALACVTFIGSMFIANDMALLTFLPLGARVLQVSRRQEQTAFLFVLQNISANLGGMLTPFGNPQNLYLYSHFSIPDGEFMLIMLPYFLLAVGLIALCCLFVPKEEIHLHETHPLPLPKGKTAFFVALFALSVAIVFRGVPFLVGLAVIPVALLFTQPKALKQVDYGLLFTFVAFFIFAGNMGRISAVRELFSAMLQKNTLLTSIASCQVISNVPSAILLSQFTQNYPALLVGVNLGGTGTLIASLASLITFRQFRKLCPGQTGRYLLLFTGMNLLFLLPLTLLALCML